MSDLEKPDGHEGGGELEHGSQADPGLPAHQWRPTDVDPKAERRAERQVASLFMLSAVSTVLFVIFYFTFDVGDDFDLVFGLGSSTVALGLTLAGSLLGIGIGTIQWSRKLMADQEIVEMRHPARSSDEDRQATLDALSVGTEESGITRRPLIRNSLLGSLALLGAPATVLLRDLGPLPDEVEGEYPGAGLRKTVWEEGMHIVRDGQYTRIRAADLEIGELINALPEIIEAKNEEGEHILHGEEKLIAKSKSALIVLRMDPAEIKPGEGREDWGVEGILAYSKICTHVGCPISLLERTTNNVLCPCHQSTFDLADSAKVVFGPAARSLPQLPIALDEEGYLVAQRDFDEPVGASYWGRNE